MSIFAMIKEALRIARTHKSLWIFGFLVGFGGNVNFGGRGEQVGLPVPAAPPELGTIVSIGLVVVAVLVVAVILRFLSTGALIEGVRRALSNDSMTVSEGFREGWAHWGVLFRIGLLYLLFNAISAIVLFGGCMLVWRVFGSPAVFVAGGIAALIGIPWLLTLYMWQSFAERIAVLEDRRALDAIYKARLFLHGRLRLGLKLLAAGFLGVFFVFFVGAALIAPIAAIVIASAAAWGVVGAVGLGLLTLLPAAFVAFAVIGIVTSSVWTIGYLQQVEQ
ncbi:MAG TPA: hypothetical protein VM692_03310 [Gammaproteobacteria bacterium]|nr:hypothetical protein [Gammaproteobacteria bacterium]